MSDQNVENTSSISECIKLYLEKKLKKKIEGLDDPIPFYRDYIKNLALDADKLYVATHPSKFIHSSTKSQDVVCKNFETIDSILDTNSLKNIEFDITCSAKYSSIHSFLKISDANGKEVINYIKEDDVSVFDFLDIDKEERYKLIELFKCAYKEDTELSVDSKLKQIFFKVGDGYKILIPLFSSSLQQKIFEEIELKTRTKDYQETYKAYKEDRLSDKDISFYPKTAVMSMGGTKAQNVSQLNSVRAGKVFLFNNQPPILHFNKFKIEPFVVNIFKSRLFITNLKPLLSSLAWFFVEFKDKDSNKKLRHSRDVQLQGIANCVVDTMYLCKDNNPEGFSDNLKLKKEHKYFIDRKYKINGSTKTDAIKLLAYDLAEYSVVYINNKKFKKKLSFDNIDVVISKFEEQFFSVFLKEL